ncbi:MAG: glutamine-hydrolyzing carbamoyl-phosphate synthase small subunit [Firmicutes bacterium]|nr:glutamine-hydrolyzing carbamoyl-phosphate synthase small subunit [Bacillota bacterium]
MARGAREAWLVLEDGTAFSGRAAGAPAEVAGEVVFSTSMTGYQEILTDPSYAGQIVVLTYPLIGNYGANSIDQQASRPWALGLVARELSPHPSSWRMEETLQDYLDRHGIPAVEGLDTRALVRRLREKGTMRGVLSTRPRPVEELAEMARAVPDLSRQDLIGRVSTDAPYQLGEGRRHIAVVDLGCKRNILDSLVERDCRVTVLPAKATAAEILDLQPDGVLFSNGPGDPKQAQPAIAAARELIGKVPVFGICLGHQVLALACGADTYKLKYGHRGANHPVKDLESGKVYITSQNHGYAVREESLSGLPLVVTQRNVNDGTVEGLRHTGAPVMSVQYHPEASPGPKDSSFLFEAFLAQVAGAPGPG